jgi:hypothetical protein
MSLDVSVCITYIQSKDKTVTNNCFCFPSIFLITLFVDIFASGYNHTEIIDE